MPRRSWWECWSYAEPFYSLPWRVHGDQGQTGSAAAGARGLASRSSLFGFWSLYTPAEAPLRTLEVRGQQCCPQGPGYFPGPAPTPLAQQPTCTHTTHSIISPDQTLLPPGTAGPCPNLGQWAPHQGPPTQACGLPVGKPSGPLPTLCFLPPACGLLCERSEGRSGVAHHPCGCPQDS